MLKRAIGKIISVLIILFWLIFVTKLTVLGKLIRFELLVTHGCSIKLINCTHVISCNSQSTAPAHTSQGVEWRDILDPFLQQPASLPRHSRVTPQLFHGQVLVTQYMVNCEGCVCAGGCSRSWGVCTCSSEK